MTSFEEMGIIGRVLAGDGEAFEALVLANQKNVYNLSVKITRNEQDALDISQEAFIKAYSSLRSFRGDCRFSVWIYRIAYNLCIDFKRKGKRTATVPLIRQDEDGQELEMEIPDGSATPERQLLESEKRRVILESLEKLGEKHRRLLIMRELSGLSYAEIASVLKTNEGTVKSGISRARRKLVGILENEGTFPESFRHEDNGNKGGGAK